MRPVYSDLPRKTPHGERISTAETYELEGQFTKFLLLSSSFTKLL